LLHGRGHEKTPSGAGVNVIEYREGKQMASLFHFLHAGDASGGMGPMAAELLKLVNAVDAGA
jgi:hypothetical protein